MVLINFLRKALYYLMKLVLYEKKYKYNALFVLRNFKIMKNIFNYLCVSIVFIRDVLKFGLIKDIILAQIVD